MAVPIVNGLTPMTGAAWGRDLVRLSADNLAAQVSVAFGGAAAEVIGVNDVDGWVDLRTPRCPTQEPGAVDVVIRNLDDDGEPVAGEVATLVGGFVYERADSVLEGNLGRLARELLRRIKQQLLAATGLDVSVDYDEDADDGVRMVHLAEVPSITLSGPRMPVNRQLQRRERRYIVVEGTGGAELVRLAPAKTVDLVWTMTIATRSKAQLFNLVEACGAWLNVNPRLSMLADETDPSSTVRWPLEHGEFRMSPKGPDDLRAATLEITVRGFNLHEGRPLDRGRLVDDTVVVAEQK